ncbi:MAG: glycosyltransferase [Verrucomicrobia bacterium]|jgi:glycosyltransferase involved in cell wall biosynthesis|nr:glycosyltransferase [Verrucomicrobiota bacterium]
MMDDVGNEGFGAVRSIGLIGNLGGDVAVYNGQTLRTRLVRNEIISRLGEDAARTADSSETLGRPLHLLMDLVEVFRGSDVVLIMPGERGLRVLLPLFLLFRRVWNKPVHYLVVGGWLPRFLSTRPILRKAVARLDGLHVQSQRMCRELAGMGLTRVSYLPNFRNFVPSAPTESPQDGPLRLVFLSRVIPEKGVALSAESVRIINRRAETRRVTLDIWGPLNDSHQDWLEGLLQLAPDAIRYCGTVEPAHVVSLLAEYDLLLFPTWYSGEGFPGVVVEAYAAGIPVLASRWQDNKEVIEEGVTGVLVEPHDQAALTTALLHVLEHPSLLTALKKGASERAEMFHVDNVIPALFERLGVSCERQSAA